MSGLQQTSTAPGHDETEESPGLVPGLRYRPYLDGLRALAVYLVVLFHAGSDRFTGGYVGVDVFFVLSGYLVTTLLLRDRQSRGSIRFGRFYARRCRRLLPAAFVTLIVTALVFSAISSPVEVLNAAGAFKAAFVYVTNWYFIHQSADYFAPNINANPVLHFWSLAVEEQFYLLWPLVLTGIFVVAKRVSGGSRRFVQLAVASAALLSVVWAWSLRTTDPSRAYFGTDARAYQLLAGALLALSPGLIALLAGRDRVARVLSVVGLVGLVVVASSWIDLDAIQRGTVVTVLTVATIAGLEAARGGVASAALSRPTAVYLGRISYGTYLWHWPVILVIERTFDPSTLATITLTVMIATALASLSFQLLEQPVRLSALLDRHRATVIAVGLTASIAGALIVIPAIDKPSGTTSATAAAAATTGFTPVPAGLDWEAIKREYPPATHCSHASPTDCTIVDGTGPHIMLIGDSNARMLIPTFTALARAENLRLSVSVRGGCPWQQGLFTVPRPVQYDCSDERDDLYNRVIPALAPDLIVAVDRDYESTTSAHFAGSDLQPLAKGSPEAAAVLDRVTRDSVAKLSAPGRNVLLVEPLAAASDDFDPVSCLSAAKVVEQCRFVANTEPLALEQTYRKLDQESDHIWSADFDRLVCPFAPICDPIINGQVVRFDDSHLTSPYAESIMPAVRDFLRTNGVLTLPSR